ncbi:MAG TPA: acyl-CoA dehydrogenase family protein [Gemmataceae bacterium]|nr:acyl-CoA dehydrogenase family protein [Gemmataceae bacterium]
MPAEMLPADTLATLSAHAAEADSDPAWPEVSWAALRAGGVLGWAVPRAHGGQESPYPDLLAGYERLAGACLTTCFILSQRDAACRRLRDGENAALREQLLPPLANGDTFATVGLSQLTTSRQHLGPALTARLADDAVLLDGTIPWVTGADRADHIIVGAVLHDGRQVLLVLPRGLAGLSVGPPLQLAALVGSLTAEVRCAQVRVDRRWLLAGPAVNVMTLGGRASTGGLETSCLALGLTGAAVGYLDDEASRRPELQPRAARLGEERQQLREQMYALALSGVTAAAAAANLRAGANGLVLRATQAALTAAKGAGFLRSHPAQRWARQALFFLVWSCPRPAAEATLALLAPDVCSL